jgi:hypothetical protein
MDKNNDFIKKQIEKYQTIKNDCDSDIKDFNNIIRLSEKHFTDSKVEIITDFKKVIENNLKTSQNLKKIATEQIKMLQDNCEHYLEYDGSNSHYTYEKCKFCGYIEKI